MAARPLSLGTLLLGIGGAIGALGVLSLLIGIATRPDDAPAPAIVPGPIGPALVLPDASAPPELASDPPQIPYPLDDLPRRPELASTGCPDVSLVDHESGAIPWRPAFRVSPIFESHVRALEALIVQTAREIYGESPTALLSASGYRCTTVRGRPERISEHALGNAIDVRGIELGERTITVRDHYRSDAGFFRLLLVRAHDRGLFRGIIGPPRADHLDHLHFDQGPSSFFDLELP